jgi:hypothetical protein
MWLSDVFPAVCYFGNKPIVIFVNEGFTGQNLPDRDEKFLTVFVRSEERDRWIVLVSFSPLLLFVYAFEQSRNGRVSLHYFGLFRTHPLKSSKALYRDSPPFTQPSPLFVPKLARRGKVACFVKARRVAFLNSWRDSR